MQVLKVLTQVIVVLAGVLSASFGSRAESNFFVNRTYADQLRALVAAELISDDGNHEGGLAIVENVLKANPKLPHAYVTRGFIKRRLGRLIEAYADYDTALRLSPGLSVAHNNRAWALFLDNRLDEALASAELAVSNDSLEPNWEDTRAIVLTALGRKKEALASYKRVLEIGREAETIRLEQLLRATGYISPDVESVDSAILLGALKQCIEAKCALYKSVHGNAKHQD